MFWRLHCGHACAVCTVSKSSKTKEFSEIHYNLLCRICWEKTILIKLPFSPVLKKSNSTPRHTHTSIVKCWKESAILILVFVHSPHTHTYSLPLCLALTSSFLWWMFFFVHQFQEDRKNSKTVLHLKCRALQLPMLSSSSYPPNIILYCEWCRWCWKLI